MKTALVLWMVAVVLAAITGCGFLPDRDERELLARAAIRAAVERVGEVLADEMEEDGTFTAEEITKVVDFYRRRTDAFVDRIWAKVAEAAADMPSEELEALARQEMEVSR